ncbi:energy transducer TonB [Psychrobacter sp. HII-4]|uniref:energy transducer TonB n=1 Tax=Psychrobacter sp. HII-4 TaxID=1569264 RepID=UPI001918163F|nr:energy transducer TonB [Psychrobacter sp. HII-4]
MSSTILDAPSPKQTLAAAVVVVGLHALTVAALVAMKAPEKPVEAKIQTPPIEIELVTLPQKEPVAVVEEEAPKVQPAPPKPKAAPTVKAQPKPIKEPVIKEKPPKATPPKKAAPPKKVIEKQPDIIKTEAPKIPATEPKFDTQAADEQRKAEERRRAEERRIREQEQQKAEQEARDRAAAQEAERLAAEKAAKEQAAKEAAEAAAQAKAKAAASNTPVNFTASNADWASPPRLSFPKRAARNARSGDTFNVVLVLRVNKQGGIDSVRVSQPSGNPRVDNAAQRQVRSGKFTPFTQNGVPVVGNVTLTVSYAVP